MPEIPDNASDWEQFLPTEERDDRFVNVQMPRSALRAMTRDAKAFRQAQAEASGLAGDTPLEEGEADLQAQRRALAADAPADVPQPSHPAAEAQAVHDKLIGDGAPEKVAIGAALNSLVNAAARGDQRALVQNEREWS
jgi:hypothetical protein